MDKVDSDKIENDQQREQHAELREERKTRGDTRASHLEAGRELARSESAQTHERKPAQPQPTEGAVTNRT
ncbi:MAG: hypothetical protein WCD37_02435 [Chloroflexia bacterium]